MFSLKLSSPSKEYFENLKTYLLAKFGEKVKKEVLAREEKNWIIQSHFHIWALKLLSFLNYLMVVMF